MVTQLYACIFILTHLTLYATGCSLRTSTHPNSIYAAELVITRFTHFTHANNFYALYAQRSVVMQLYAIIHSFTHLNSFYALYALYAEFQNLMHFTHFTHFTRIDVLYAAFLCFTQGQNTLSNFTRRGNTLRKL